MSVKQRWILYAIIIFMICWGVDIINDIKYQQPLDWRNYFSLFGLIHIIYIIVILVLSRKVFWKYYHEKKISFLFAGLILLAGGFIFLRYTIEEIIFPATIGMSNYNPATKIKYYILDNIYYAGLYLLMGFISFMIEYQLTARKKEMALQEQQREAELSFLRSQISPHFLFNSLNNIYSLSYRNHPETPAAILTLSELMRFMLYEKQTKIPVGKEMEYIKHLIILQRLRYDYPVYIIQDADEGTDACMIAPYLLIPFVENAFKHGDVSDPQQPLTIKLEKDHDTLHFYVHNKISNTQKDKDGGIGLNNVKRRMQLLYEGKHQLNIAQTNVRFNIHLQIQVT